MLFAYASFRPDGHRDSESFVYERDAEMNSE